MLTTEHSSSCAALPRVQHDLPHGTSSLEWWYHNAHITTTCGKEITLFSSFFRLVTGYNEETKKLEYGHGAWTGLVMNAAMRVLSNSRCAFWVSLQPSPRQSSIKIPISILNRASKSKAVVP